MKLIHKLCRLFFIAHQYKDGVITGEGANNPFPVQLIHGYTYGICHTGSAFDYHDIVGIVDVQQRLGKNTAEPLHIAGLTILGGFGIYVASV